jgi:hypothetical protein
MEPGDPNTIRLAYAMPLDVLLLVIAWQAAHELNAARLRFGVPPGPGPAVYLLSVPQVTSTRDGSHRSFFHVFA